MNNKIHAVDSSATPKQARAVGGPATTGIEFDKASTVQALILQPDNQGRSSKRLTIVPLFYNAGAPTNGTSGTFAGQAAVGADLLDTSNNDLYTNLGTVASPTWVYVQSKGGPTAITASGAIAVRPSRSYVITKAGVAAMTLAAPTAGAPGTGDDGVEITVLSSTAFAHTITATGLLQTGSASVNLATFAANAGASLTLVAFNGKWIAKSQIGVTFS